MSPSDTHDAAWRQSIQRELDFVRADIAKAHEDLAKATAVLVDAQVRLAQIEAKEPVSKDEFDPIKRLVWGFVFTVLSGVLIAILALVGIKAGPVRF